MYNFSGKSQLFLLYAVGAGLALLPLASPSASFAQQNSPTNQQTATQAGPPPNAQNGQAPPAAGDIEDGQSIDDDQNPAAPPPPPPAANSSQQGQWGPAGPPPDAQNGQVPPPPQQPAYSGRAPYQSQQGPYQGQQYDYQAQNVPPSGPVTIGAGTLLQIRTQEPLDTKKLQPGDYFQGTVANGIYVGNVLAIPRGAQVVGRVVDVKKPGDLKGSGEVALRITSLNLGGNGYQLVSDTWSSQTPGKGGYTAGNAVGGAALGAVIGAIAGGGPGAAIGAAAGTGVGLGASAATPGPRSVIPPESMLAFHLTQPVTVQPVSYQEAQRLAQESAPPQPQYRQPYGPGPYPYAPAAAYYPYAYPYPYPYVYAYPRAYVYGYPYRGYYWRYRR